MLGEKGDLFCDRADEQLAQLTADPDWIRVVGERGWIGFHKDAAIRRNDLERAVDVEHGSRLFCVPRADIIAADLAQRFLIDLPAMQRAPEERGPFLYGV